MDQLNKFFTPEEFHKSEPFQKLNKHIDTCASLLKKIISFNKKCQEEAQSLLQIDKHIIDYRTNQFNFYHNTLDSVLYSCLSLKYVFEINNLKSDLFDSLNHTIENQRSYITFNAIVKFYSILEYTRKVFDKKTTPKDYFGNLQRKYPDLAESLILLKHFRHTIHSNGKWEPKQNGKNLTYNLREGKQIIKPGEVFIYDHWLLYRLFKDCIKLSLLIALDNEPNKVRSTTFQIDGVKPAVLITNIDWDKLIKK